MTRPVTLAALLLLVASPVTAQDHPLCQTTPAGPFVVTSGAPFLVSWVMTDTVAQSYALPNPPESGATGSVTVPHRVNGFYLQIDGGPKEDIGLATAHKPCSAATPRAGDIPYDYKTKAGVSRGNHTLTLNAWNYTLDGNGQPTTTRQEGPAVTVPFAGDDPIQTSPPEAPTSVTITK